MRTSIKVSRDYENIKDLGVKISIVTGSVNKTHSHEFQVFSINGAIPEIGTIGVTDEIFALSFLPNFYGRFCFAVYLDGVNSNQTYGVKSINSIPEHLRHQYKQHQGKFISENDDKNICYLDRYLQKNNENRIFKFTSRENAGLNENLISDPSNAGKIEVYVWKEYQEEYDEDADYMICDTYPMSKSKIGAGKSTNKKFGTASHLQNPTFLGKATFIHQPMKDLQHLGELIVSVKIDDPMDNIPQA